MNSRTPRPSRGDRASLPDIPDLDAIAACGDGPVVVERAQELIYEAWEAPTPARRRALARRALAVSPLCADAYAVLATLAEAEGDLRTARGQWECGVAAGARALPDGTLDEDEWNPGETDIDENDILHALLLESSGPNGLWGALHARPYLRARAGLADNLWRGGERAERAQAIGHARALLRLNPDDNQGIRDLLLAWLLTTGTAAALTEASHLLACYDDMSAHWAFGRALLAFRQIRTTATAKADAGGARRTGVGLDAARAEIELRTALEVNPYVAPVLLGLIEPPLDLPGGYSTGSLEEALLYADEAGEAWETTAGALAWLIAILLDIAVAACVARADAARQGHLRGDIPSGLDDR